MAQETWKPENPQVEAQPSLKVEEVKKDNVKEWKPTQKKLNKEVDDGWINGSDEEHAKIKNAGGVLDETYSGGQTYKFKTNNPIHPYSSVNLGRQKGKNYFTTTINGQEFAYKDLDTAIKRAKGEDGLSPYNDSLKWNGRDWEEIESQPSRDIEADKKLFNQIMNKNQSPYASELMLREAGFPSGEGISYDPKTKNYYDAKGNENPLRQEFKPDRLHELRKKFLPIIETRTGDEWKDNQLARLWDDEEGLENYFSKNPISYFLDENEDIDYDRAEKYEKINGSKAKSATRKDKYGNPLLSDEAFAVGYKTGKAFVDEIKKNRDYYKDQKDSGALLMQLQDYIGNSITNNGYNPNYDLTYQDYNEIIGSLLGEEVDMESFEGRKSNGFTGRKYMGYNPMKKR